MISILTNNRDYDFFLHNRAGGGGDGAPARGLEQSLVKGDALLCDDAGDGGPPAGDTDGGEARQVTEGSQQQRAKDKVLLRMQQFKRASPHMLVHDDGSDAAPKHPKGKGQKTRNQPNG